MEKIRLFIAVDFPEEIISELDFDAFRIKGMKWTKKEQIHLTLKFIGDYPVCDFEKLKQALNRVEFSPFSLTLSGTGFFPNSRRPSVFWLGTEPSTELDAIKRELEELLSVECGIPRDERKFVPHVTLSRFKSRIAPELTQKLQDTFAELSGKTFECKNFILFSSILNPSGAVHKKLAIFP